MSRLLFDDLLFLSRKTILAAITRALAQKSAARPWPLTLDATAGNGNDTEFMAQAVEENGLVLAFDVQAAAIANTRQRLEKTGLQSRVRLIHDSHDSLPTFLEQGGQVAASMFNLGFLPGSNSDLTTRPETTVAALKQLEQFTLPGGIISVHCYLGQDGGEEEAEAVQAWSSKIPWPEWKVARYEFCNKPNNREILYLAQKL